MWSRAASLLLLALALASAQPAPMERGLEFFSAGRFAEAEPALREAVAAKPESFEARLTLGATLAELKRPAEAIEQLQVAHRLRPGHSDTLKLLATQYMIGKQYTKAIALLCTVRDRDEEAYLLLIESYQAASDSPKSFAAAQEALKRFPKSPQVNCWIGFQLQFSGRYEDARPYLDKAIQLAPDFPATYYVLGEVLLKLDKARESVPYFEKANELDSDDIEARMGLSQAWAALGDAGKALSILQEAEVSSPKDPRVHLLLSRLWFRMGDESRARAEAKLSLDYRSSASERNLPAGLRGR